MSSFSRREFVVASAAAFPALRMLPRPIIAAAAEDRMAWWREARFGLFLHWGLYSILAGVWDGKDNYAEWIRNNAHIPVDDYDKLLQRWNPHAWDPDAWAATAKHAGMKYAVLTTKHHDGFCLFDSAVTDFDVMSTPSQRDICRDWSAALRKQGIRVGWYHSIMDWHHPDYLPRRDWEKDYAPGGRRRLLAVRRPTCTRRSTSCSPTTATSTSSGSTASWETDLDASAGEGATTRSAPGIRRSSSTTGSTARERPRAPGWAISARPEQTDSRHRDAGEGLGVVHHHERQLGLTRRPDHNWKSPRRSVESLVETASKGGNLLLNIGPMADGRSPEAGGGSAAIVGDWMQLHGDTIHGTTASLFADTTRFQSTTRGNSVHLFVSDWTPGALPLPGLKTRPVRAWARLGGGKRQTLAVNGTAGSFALTLPASAPATLYPVITVEFASAPVVG